MKTLLLMRHGKSSWDDVALADFERPLMRRGIEASTRMGRELARRGWTPSLALVSPALRTRQTWELVAAELPEQPAMISVEALYDASADELLAEIRGVDKKLTTLIVVGHNPGLQELALSLAGDKSDKKALARLNEKYPTAAISRFVFSGKWRELGKARLTHCLRPRDLD